MPVNQVFAPGERDADRSRPDAPPPLLGVRDATELELSGIWAEVLGVDSVGRDDDFFDLGGTSFQAVGVQAAVAEHFDVTLDPADILRKPTVAALAEVIRARAPAVDHASLVPIRVAGAGSPVFCFHPLSGTVIRYARLAATLPKDVPVYGVQSYGLDPRFAPHTSIEEMAAAYVEEMWEVQSGGDFALLGYSMGGIIAYEVARLLRARGAGVSLLGMIDTAPSVSEEPVDYALPLLIRKGLRLDIDPRPLADVPFEESVKALLDAAIEAGSVPADYHASHLRRMLEMYHLNGRAIKAHTVRPAPERVTLFRSDEPGSPTLGWEEFAAHVRVVRVPGDHFHVMEPGGVEVIAGEVAAVCDPR